MTNSKAPALRRLEEAERVCQSVEALLEEAKRGYLDWRLLEIQLSDWRKAKGE